MIDKLIVVLVIAAVAFNLLLMEVSAESLQGSNNGNITEMNDLIIEVNGRLIDFDVKPIIKNNRTLVPLRAIFESIGAIVQWNGKDQMIYATRNNRSIKLGINSINALVNGIENKTMDVPATLYKNRTFVPLRFVGEAFDGTVQWDGKTKKITIIIPGNVIKDVLTPIYLNNKRLDFDSVLPIFKNDITYIPLEPVLQNLVNEVYWTMNNHIIDLQIDGTTVQFFIDQNYMIMDGKKIELTEFPIEYNGNVLMPINVLANILGGYSHYTPETKEIYIYANRPKFKHEFLTKEALKFVNPSNVEKANFIGSRRLMVSDNPENLNDRTIQVTNATLWDDEVKSNEQSVDHRVFGWHVNEFDQNLSIAITIENLSISNEIEIVELKGTYRQSSNGWVNYDIGLPVAEYVLSDKMTKVKMNNPVIKPQEITIMKAFDVKEASTIGFSYDFTVKKKSGTGELNYKIRTVMSKEDTDLATIFTDPVPIDRYALHPRGVWESSQLETELPAYVVGSEEVSYQISNGATDNLMSIENGIGDQAEIVKNPGHFGASYIVKIPVVNETGNSKTVRIRLGARGGLYNGAVKVNEKVYLTPTLKPMNEVANVTDYVIDKQEDVIELEIMHGGGSALPLVINMITVEK